jgi:ATP-dependent DNA helicase RecG
VPRAVRPPDAVARRKPPPRRASRTADPADPAPPAAVPSPARSATEAVPSPPIHRQVVPSPRPEPPPLADAPRVSPRRAARTPVAKPSATPVPAASPPRRSAKSPAPAATSSPPPPPAAPGRETSPPSLPDWDGLAGLPGVGPKTAAKLAAQGLASCWQLARWLPIGYRDHRRRDRVDQLADGAEGLVVATVRRFRQSFFRGRFHATMECVQTTPDGPRVFVARWFHRVGGLAERAAAGRRVLLIGRVQRKGDTVAMVHPELRDADLPLPAIDVRYPDIDGLGDASVARLCRAALARLVAHVPGDPLPAELRARLDLPALLPALQLLHDPPEDLSPGTWREVQEGRSSAHRRALFDELLHVQLALLRQRAAYRAVAPPVGLLPADGDRRERLRVCVPFEPTAAQWRAIDEVEADLAAGQPMLRLLQGDVGSGKTLVAFAAALCVIDAGGQAALMAPTEILAAQHLQTLAPWCAAAGVRVALLTGATPRPERTRLRAAIAAGEVDLVIGTHALLTEGVAFRRLGLVVVDEQHRFGVRQRALLRDKGPAPHLLVMTATPIPRTLALTLHGELDVSILDELPPGRIPPTTRLFAGKSALAPARAALAELVLRGRQAFVVCPQVEAGAREVSDVEAAAADLRARLPGRAVGVLHGRMNAAAKDAVIAAFRAGELDLVVATTVIEVGVDIPAAQAILVEHADCFGLAQLHQLRGRIGRGAPVPKASRHVPEDIRPVCLLHTAAAASAPAAARLQVLVDTTDGFRVAERDLAERGPGELFGLRQAGSAPLHLAGLAGEGVRLLAAAREAAQELIARDPDLRAHAALRAEQRRRAAAAAIVGGDAG